MKLSELTPMLNKVLIIFVSLLILSCANQNNENGDASTANAVPEGAMVCEGEPPQICTMEYAPVCGSKAGVEKTYGNGCGACGDSVDFYIKGECS